jgi:hypothetical protein
VSKENAAKTAKIFPVTIARVSAIALVIRSDDFCL